MSTVKVKLLRELLVEPNATQSTPAGTTVEMDAARAKELSKRDPALVEIIEGEKAAAPVENKMAAEPVNKAAAPTEAEATDPARDENRDSFEREPVRMAARKTTARR